ncbi:hypothetical protein HN51_050337 [Arachis hypogaea]
MAAKIDLIRSINPTKLAWSLVMGLPDCMSFPASGTRMKCLAWRWFCKMR